MAKYKISGLSYKSHHFKGNDKISRKSLVELGVLLGKLSQLPDNYIINGKRVILMTVEGLDSITGALKDIINNELR